MSEPIPYHTPCARCQSLLKNKNPINDDAPPDGSTGDLVQSAKNGCRLCAMALSLLKADVADDDYWEGIMSGSLTFSISFQVERSDGRRGFQIYYISSDGIYRKLDGVSRFYACISIHISVEDRWLEQPELIDSPCADPSHFPGRIEQWLATCSREHGGRCNANSRPLGGFVPSRLVRVESGGDFSSIYVVQRQDVCRDQKADMRYTTLSHCWGLKRSLVLEKSTSSTLQKGVPVKELPKTFRDAVHLTQQLGIHYIWIDALCIFQDWDEDWRMEATTMSEVYSNSFLNIAASTAKDDEGGIFFPRDTLPLTPFKTEIDLQLVTSIPDKEQFAFKGSYIFCKPEFLEELTSVAPLYRRAWVFQERVLAPRTVHFGPLRMFWECSENIASEVPPGPMPSLRPPRSSRVKALTISIKDKIQLWQDLVEGYSRGRLTVSSDKLIAISGVAREFHLSQELRSEDYHAGLWAPSLELQLLWRLRQSGRRSDDYRAPSWSWAAVDGNVTREWRLDEVESLLAVEEAVTVPVADPFGAVKPGCFIRITAYLSAVRVPMEVVQSNVLFIYAPGFSETTFLQHFCAIHWDDYSITETVDLTARRVVLMASHWFTRRHAGRLQKGLIGLVLMGSEDQTGEYVRVGYFDTNYKIDNARETLLSAFQASNLEEEYYEAYDATTGKYTIKII